MLDILLYFGYNITCVNMNTHKLMLINDKGGAYHEENLPAQEETEKKGTRFQKENGNR